MRPALLTLLAAGCAAPDPGELFYGLDLEITDAQGTSDAFVSAVKGAEDSVHIAMPGGDDTALAEALAEAHDAGIEVEVIADVDLAESPAVSMLLASEVPVALADGALAYFDFAYNEDVGWTSGDIQMTSAWAVIDRDHALGATDLGNMGAGDRVVLTMDGEMIVEDLLTEHNQVFGGIDATATTAYDGLAKSILDTRWAYGTDDEVVLEMWFGPQERLVKRVIDAIYSARSSVWILTDDFSNDGLARALQDKARWGFDVRAIVGPDYGHEDIDLLTDRFERDTPDVQKSRITDRDLVPTLILVDHATPGKEAQAFLMTHSLYSSARLQYDKTDQEDPIKEVRNDQLTDGVAWTLRDNDGTSAELAALVELFEAHEAAAGGL